MSFLDKEIKIRTLIDIAVYISFYIVIVLSTIGATFNLIEFDKLRVMIQKQGVVIEALATSCKLDWLIRKRRGR